MVQRRKSMRRNDQKVRETTQGERRWTGGRVSKRREDE